MRFILSVCLLLVSGCVDAKKSDIDNWAFHSKLNGGMRLDRHPVDAPLDRDLLVRNFRKIAYDLELDPFGVGEDVSDANRTPLLKRWEEAVRMRIVQDDDALGGVRSDTLAFMRRLSGLAGFEFEIEKNSAGPDAEEYEANLLVFMGEGAFFDEAIVELADLAEDQDAEESGFAGTLLEFFEIWHNSSSPCAGQSYTEFEDKADTGRIFFAIVAIRTDFAEPMTQSCIEEELAQSMGLMNDDDSVRPSMFNDDNEFALMTRHDELLLEILYDGRLEPGMTPENSMPIVRQIAAELLPDA